MTQRGRKSAETLAAMASAEQSVVRIRRPAPDDLSEHEAEIWTNLQNAFQAGWFSAEDDYMLRAYCAAVALHDRLAVQAPNEPVLVPGRFGPQPNPIFGMMAKQAGVIASLGGKLRISKASRTAPSSASGRTGLAAGLSGAANDGAAPAMPWNKQQ